MLTAGLYIHLLTAAKTNDAYAGRVAGRLFAPSKGFYGQVIIKLILISNILTTLITALDQSHPDEKDGIETLFSLQDIPPLSLHISLPPHTRIPSSSDKTGMPDPERGIIRIGKSEL